MVSTGHALDENLINTVYNIFDENNDGDLSYHEFIGVMKDRIHRGFKVNIRIRIISYLHVHTDTY